MRDIRTNKTLNQESANYDLWVKSSQPLIFVNKILLEQGHTQYFKYCMYMAACFSNSRVKCLQHSSNIEKKMLATQTIWVSKSQMVTILSLLENVDRSWFFTFSHPTPHYCSPYPNKNLHFPFDSPNGNSTNNIIKRPYIKYASIINTQSWG